MENKNKKNNTFMTEEDKKIWKEAINNIFNYNNIYFYNKENYDINTKNQKFSKFITCNHKNKSKKSKIYFESFIDLHGLKQHKAYILLLNFLKYSYERKLSIVLVITGKGKLYNGVLQKFVPLWLETKTFLYYVNDFYPAKYYHGGSGALYVKLKKNNY